MKYKERETGEENEKVSTGVSACGFERSKKSEQGKQDILSYRSTLSSFTTYSSNICNAIAIVALLESKE